MQSMQKCFKRRMGFETEQQSNAQVGYWTLATHGREQVHASTQWAFRLWGAILLCFLKNMTTEMSHT